MDIDKLTLKFISEKLNIQNGENIIKVEKMKVDITPISRLTMKPQKSELCGIGGRTDLQSNGTKKIVGVNLHRHS